MFDGEDIFKDDLTEFEDGGEILVHLLFEFIDLCLRHLVFGVVKDFLAEHLQNIEVILADVHIFGGGGTDVVDEGAPGGIPLVFDDLDEDGVKLGQDVVH